MASDVMVSSQENTTPQTPEKMGTEVKWRQAEGSPASPSGLHSPSTPLNSSDPRSPLKRFSFFSKRKSSSPSTNSGFPTPQKTSDGLPTPPSRSLFRRDSLMIKVRAGQTFTPNADIFVESMDRCNPKLGTLGELRHFLQTGGKPQVKKFLRIHNWPQNHRVRAELWKQLVPEEKLDPSVIAYTQEISRINRSTANPGEIPQPSFLGGRIPMNCDRKLKHSGKQSLFKVLAVIENLRPDVTEAPLLYPLAALMLHYHSEEDTFCCINWLLDQGSSFIMQTNIAYQASQRTLVILAKKHTASAYNAIQRLVSGNDDADLIPIFENWIYWIFRDLPFFHLVRIIDCFMCEGQKILFRSILAILTLWHHERKKELKRVSHLSCEEVAQDIASFCHAIPAMPEKFLKIAFGVRNLALSTIMELQKNNERRLREGRGNVLSGASVYGRDKDGSPRRGQKGASTLPGRVDMSLWESDILTQTALVQELFSWVPDRMQLHVPRRLFAMSADGKSFTRLWQLIDDAEPTIILIKASTGEIFGAYCATDWGQRKAMKSVSYFGRGETFLFRLSPSPEKFDWVGNSRRENFNQAPGHNEQLFQAADASSLIIGGGGSEGLSIREELVTGLTNRCDTFDNAPLVETGSFDIEDLEVFALVDSVEE